MSKLARALVLAATLTVMNLAGMAAVAHAQANDQDTTTQREVTESWSYYQQATRMSPAELKAWMQGQDRPEDECAGEFGHGCLRSIN